MSNRTDNRHRVATICREATGLPHHTCMQWAADGLISRTLPVPDAEGADQRALEAELLVNLANGLRHEQLGGAVLGLVRAVPRPEGAEFWVHPAMGSRVLSVLLPRIDSYRMGHGLPGLRPVREGSRVRLRSLRRNASVVLVHPDPDWAGYLDEPACEEHIWWHHRDRMHPDEATWHAGTREPDPDRDLLLSRLIRRPALVNATGSAHGWANTYSRGDREVFIEWCCSVEVDDLARRLRRSGLTSGQDGRSRSGSRRLAFGDAAVIVRKGPCGLVPPALGARAGAC
ncbi:hypothetical protein [Streptomyces xanthophaeus]|uniref:hypothetical protein n=1 Tax=Streptomyces xanthophaeus TaxID=67385 RepID=UPI0026490330|nr:hypothetical protein [Streptomyces xanthophaeus]WKD32427.1 hypothetical protein KO717_10995 [Streptomyces xanthophaeus]